MIREDEIDAVVRRMKFDGGVMMFKLFDGRMVFKKYGPDGRAEEGVWVVYLKKLINEEEMAVLQVEVHDEQGEDLEKLVWSKVPELEENMKKYLKEDDNI